MIKIFQRSIILPFDLLKRLINPAPINVWQNKEISSVARAKREEKARIRN